MKNRSYLFILLAGILIGSVSSCGKAVGNAPENVECSYRYISGHDCIVCGQGGVSCKW